MSAAGESGERTKQGAGRFWHKARVVVTRGAEGTRDYRPVIGEVGVWIEVEIRDAVEGLPIGGLSTALTDGSSVVLNDVSDGGGAPHVLAESIEVGSFSCCESGVTIVPKNAIYEYAIGVNQDQLIIGASEAECRHIEAEEAGAGGGGIRVGGVADADEGEMSGEECGCITGENGG